MRIRGSIKLFLAALSALSIVIFMGGCMRKHVVSSPPAQKPAERMESTPAPEPTVMKENSGLIEETYVVDAPADDAPKTTVQEGDLVDEPTAEKAAAPASEAVNMDDSSKAVPATTAATTQPVSPDAVQAEREVVEETAASSDAMYYVQVGAFTDLENANRALARLLSDGYKGSRLSKTDEGLFRVQAGAFTDEDSANEALLKLQADYPKGFVLTLD